MSDQKEHTSTPENGGFDPLKLGVPDGYSSQFGGMNGFPIPCGMGNMGFFNPSNGMGTCIPPGGMNGFGLSNNGFVPPQSVTNGVPPGGASGSSAPENVKGFNPTGTNLNLPGLMVSPGGLHIPPEYLTALQGGQLPSDGCHPIPPSSADEFNENPFSISGGFGASSKITPKKRTCGHCKTFCKYCRKR